MCRRALWLVFLCFGTFAAAPLSAQVASGQLTGTVKDPAGASVPGATITATNVANNAVRSTVSTTDGVYTVPSLLPGEYRLAVQLSGFRSEQRDGIHLATGQTLRLNFALTIGDVKEQVTIHADAPVLRAESASLGTVIDHEKIVELPLNGRSFISLATLAPGIAMPPPPQAPLPRINGGRPRTNEYLFDGISVLQPEPGQVAFFPVVDAIQEFTIESNSPPAEFGRFNGGVVNLTTKAGGNAFHGDGFEFLRNEALNARNFFSSTNPVKPEFRRNQYGGTLGGPLVKGHTFFFADFQGQRQAIGRTVTSTVPTLLERQGIFTEAIAGKVPTIYNPATTASNGTGGFTRTPFSGNAIPVGQMDPVALALLARYPNPTSAGTANNYKRTDNEIDNQEQADIRVDHRFGGDRDSMFGRLTYFHDDFIPVTPLPEGSGVTSGTLGPQDTKVWAFASNYQHVFSNSLVNELRVGDTRRTVGRTAAELAAAASTATGIPGIPSYAPFPNTLPTFLITGDQQLGSPVSTASNFHTEVAEVADSLSWLKGRHTFKAGFDWRWELVDVIQPPSPTGQFTFNTIGSDLPGTTGTGNPLASFLLGEVQNFQIDLQLDKIQNRARIQEYFVQDDWKVSDRLTISPGLRYTLNFPSTEKNNNSAVFNLDTQQLEYLGKDGNPDSARRLQKHDFGPRLGIAYSLNDKTVVSSGYAMVWIEQAGITTPFTTPSFPFLQTVTERSLDSVNPAFILSKGPTVAPIALTPNAGLGQGVFAVDADLGSGYVQQANVSVQRELTRHASVEVAYVASKITRVGLPDTNLNQLTPAQLALGNALLAKVPNPYYGIIPASSSLGDPTIAYAQLLKPYPEFTTVSLYRNNVGTTFYQGVELAVRQRLAHGFSYSFAYTHSVLKDDASSVFDASILTGPIANYPVADSFNRKLERDYSTGDTPNVIAASATWDIPFGSGRAHRLHGIGGILANDWSATAIVTLQSGMPIAVTQTTNFNAFAGYGVQRPNVTGDPEKPSDQRTVQQWFNTAAFTIAPQFTLGDSSRNPVRGPAYHDVDLALIRRFPVGGARSIECRVEAFNLFNVPPLGAPNGVAGTAAFGSITTAGDPRVIQLAAKVLF